MFALPQMITMKIGIPCVRLVPTPVGPIPVPAFTMGPGAMSVLADYTVLTFWMPTMTRLTMCMMGIPALPMPGAVSGTPIGPTVAIMSSFKTFFTFMPSRRAFTDSGTSCLINSPNSAMGGSSVLILA